MTIPEKNIERKIEIRHLPIRLITRLDEGAHKNIKMADSKMADAVTAILELQEQNKTMLENQSKMIEKLTTMEEKYENAMSSIKKLESNYIILKDNVDGVMKSQGFLDDKYEEQKKLIDNLDKQVKLLISENNKMKSTNTELSNSLHPAQRILGKLWNLHLHLHNQTLMIQTDPSATNCPQK